ncbi:radical SAM protein [Corallococcus sp. H22C18031201]|nr:radical SAM protein [Corallococcus sp. H22C18031201]
MSNTNLPIAYDFHGDVAFNVPFDQIKPEDIHIYLDLDTKVGKTTCGQNCSHCWFVNYEQAFDKAFDMKEGVLIKESLEKAGYKIYPRYVDSFAYSGDFMRLYGPAHNREFRQESDHKPTETMHKGDAWTSGRPLMGDNYVELLNLARDSGYGTISITFHGLIDSDLSVRDGKDYPIKGVFGGSKCEEVVRRIFKYNADAGAEMFRVNIGITVGRHNNSRESLVRYAQYFNKLGVHTVRFNNFSDHGGRHTDLQMSREEIEQAYRDIKWLHENEPINFQLAVSEDFGTFGIKVMGFPGHVGWCRAGRQLFAVVPTPESLLRESAGERTVKIGDVVACVNMFGPHMGELVRKTRAEGTTYALEFNHQSITEFSEKRMRGVYKNGCFARELIQEMPPALTAQARNALINRSAANEEAVD